jgi:hypothetical protein
MGGLAEWHGIRDVDNSLKYRRKRVDIRRSRGAVPGRTFAASIVTQKTSFEINL